MITAHYVNVPSDQPLEWELKSKLLDFKELQGSYNGANVAIKIIEVLDQYDIRNKVSFMFSSIRMPMHVYCILAWLDDSWQLDKALQVMQQMMPNSVQKWYAQDQHVQ